MALALTRRIGEAIMIGDDIKVVVTKMWDGKVRLAIEAPTTIPVHRKEVYDAIQRQQRQGGRDV